MLKDMLLLLFLSVLLSRRSGKQSHRDLRRNVKAVELVDAGRQNLREAQEKRQSNLRS